MNIHSVPQPEEKGQGVASFARKCRAPGVRRERPYTIARQQRGRTMRTLMVGFFWLAACGDGSGDDSSGAALVGDPVNGEKVFQSTCAQVQCHGPDGSGAKSSAADLHDQVPGKTDDEIASIITNGFASMPPQGQLSDQDIADVIAYLRQEF